MTETIAVPNAWVIHSATHGRLLGCGPYRTRQDAAAAIVDRLRNGHAFSDERPLRVRLLLSWDRATSRFIATDYV